MKRTIALLTLLSFGPALSPSQAELSVSFFYDSLEPHGEWLDVADYGYVWHPRDVEEDWRPYTSGHWVYTDAGWTWVSDEPYGWAVYHYGRWANLDRVGWVWVPGTEWGPAWVSWRRSERHVGWAPLPPEARFRVNVNIGAWADSYYDIGPASYTFVDVRNLGAPRIRSVARPWRENITIINETRNITNITYQNNIVINQGPRYEDVVRVSEQPIRRLRLDRRTDITANTRTAAALQTRVEGESLAVAAPVMTRAADAAPKRIARKVAKAEVNRGWRGAGSEQEVQALRTKMKSDAPEVPAELPKQPKYEPEDKASATTTATPAQPEKPGDSTRPPATKPGQPATTSTDGEKPGKPGEKATTTTPPTTDAPATDTPNQPRRRPGRDTERPDATTDSPRPERSPRPGATDRPDAPGTRPDARPGRPDPSARPDATDRPGRNNPATRPETPDRPGKPDRSATTPGETDKPETSGRPARGRTETPQTDRPERPDRPDRPERPERPDRPARPDAAERPARPETPSPRAERPPQPDRPERPERPSQPDRPDRPDRPERTNRPDASAAERPQPNRAERPTPRAEAPEARPNRPEARPETRVPERARAEAAARVNKAQGGNAPATEGEIKDPRAKKKE